MEFRYSGYIPHKKGHLRFNDDFLALRQRFRDEGKGVHVLLRTNALIWAWWRDHIRTRDQALARHVRG